MKPMLAANVELSSIRFPVHASPKLDGVRAMVIDGKLYSRSLKLIPNPHVQALFALVAFNGLDGELIAGDPTAKDAFRATTSAVSNERLKPVGVKFYVFDNFLTQGDFATRSKALQYVFAASMNDSVVLVPQKLVTSVEELLAFETEMLAAGYEGLILRDPRGAYKQGRSTANEQGMLKLKRFSDSEAMIIGMEEEMANTNDATRNALGRTERSGAQAGLVGKGAMGALVVRDLKSGVEFNIGTGFTAIDRRLFWKERNSIISKRMVVKYKSFLIGAKDKPRFPVYLGVRAGFDMGGE